MPSLSCHPSTRRGLTLFEHMREKEIASVKGETASVKSGTTRSDSDSDSGDFGIVGKLVILLLVGFGYYGCVSSLEESKSRSDRVCNAYTGSCTSRDSYEREEKRRQREYDDIIDSIN